MGIEAVVVCIPRHALVRTIEKSGLANWVWPHQSKKNHVTKQANFHPWETYHIGLCTCPGSQLDVAIQLVKSKPKLYGQHKFMSI